MTSPRILSIPCFIFITSITSLSSVHADEASINTTNGNELEISVSSYLYEEPSFGMSTKGDKFGIGHAGALLLDGDWFIKDDVRFVNGSVDYVGSGFHAGVPDWYVEARGLVGRDIQLENAMYSPYVGFGYRYLFNDLRGYSSSGSIGYRRESNYLYIPIGLTHRIKLDDSAVLATTLEFDHLLSGRQVTWLSDLSGYAGYAGVTDLENRQGGGFGYRGAVMYEMNELAFGPFINVWRIDQSDFVPRFMRCKGMVQWCVWSEPQNNTSEFGLRMRFRF
jgi:hypothetical protein